MGIERTEGSDTARKETHYSQLMSFSFSASLIIAKPLNNQNSVFPLVYIYGTNYYFSINTHQYHALISVEKNNYLINVLLQFPTPIINFRVKVSALLSVVI